MWRVIVIVLATFAGSQVGAADDPASAAYRAGSNIGLLTAIRDACGGTLDPTIDQAQVIAKKLSNESYLSGFNSAMAQIKSEAKDKKVLCTLGLALYGPDGRDMKGAWHPAK
jgi:hypothetical protein